MPMPVSATLTWSASGSLHPDEIRPVAVNLMALLSRLSSTCLTCVVRPDLDEIERHVLLDLQRLPLDQRDRGVDALGDEVVQVQPRGARRSCRLDPREVEDTVDQAEQVVPLEWTERMYASCRSVRSPSSRFSTLRTR
jgi:hypothetical protein